MTNEHREIYRDDIERASKALDHMGFTARVINDNNGFIPLHYDDEDEGIEFILSKIALIHSEVSEMTEELRRKEDNMDERFTEEIVDVIVRLLDLYTGMNARGFTLPDLADIYYKKMLKNSKRGYKHGKKA